MTDRTPTGDTTRSPQESERSRQGSSGSSERQGSSPQRSGSSERQGSSPQRSGSSERQGSTERSRQSRTSGTNRDFDESGESINQGHGHPREERGSRS